MKIQFDARAGEGRQRMTISWLFVVALAGWVLGATACSSFSSSSGGGKDAAAGAGGGTSTGGAGGGGGSGTGGTSETDGGQDVPMTDGPSDTALPCNPDGGDASGTCCPDGTTSTDDFDNDGVIDCLDACPTDPMKAMTVGVCGCFVADTDSDHDGVPDCNDQCPRDGTRTRPGVCGCGVADNAPLCLAHRYSFDDGPPVDGGAGDAGAADGGTSAGGIIRDSVGGADGTAVGFTPAGTGSVTLAGLQTDQYINLPTRLLSSLGPSGTFEAWVSWTGNGGFWQRIFDFGSNSGGAGLQGTGVSWLFLTPLGGVALPGSILVSMVSPVGGLTEAAGAGILAANSMQHLAVVVDDNTSADGGGPTMSLYLNGVLQTQSVLTSPLTAIDDTNNWLGRSQFSPDPEFSGTYYEFRIYSAPRSAAQIMASFQAGPDVLPAQ